MNDPVTSERIFAFGDVHGCDSALRILLEQIPFEPNDLLVFLGDIVDRGPGTRQVVDAILELRETNDVILIQGNHEEMMLAAKEGQGGSWLEYGGKETLDSYGGSLDDVPEPHWDVLKRTVPYWETRSDVFVHAGVEPDVALADQDSMWLRWTRLTGQEEPYDEGRRVVCGHTPQLHGWPGQLPGWICIDTWAYGAGFLTCLEVSTDTIYQASQQSGKFREFRLADLEPDPRSK